MEEKEEDFFFVNHIDLWNLWAYQFDRCIFYSPKIKCTANKNGWKFVLNMIYLYRTKRYAVVWHEESLIRTCDMLTRAWNVLMKSPPLALQQWKSFDFTHSMWFWWFMLCHYHCLCYLRLIWVGYTSSVYICDMCAPPPVEGKLLKILKWNWCEKIDRKSSQIINNFHFDFSIDIEAQAHKPTRTHSHANPPFIHLLIF